MKPIINGVLEPSFSVWLRLQKGQEKIIRFGKYHERFKGKLRKQNGHEHRCSVGFLFMDSLIKIRPFCLLDELLITRCVELHDIPEGITGIDLPSVAKKSTDDLKEYLVFEKLCKPLGKEVWPELRRCFLLQFALTNPKCFPENARCILAQLRLEKFREAVFFDCIQRLDYLYYAYECYCKRHVKTTLTEVTRNQFASIDQGAAMIPGFRKVIWTDKRRKFFSQFL